MMSPAATDRYTVGQIRFILRHYHSLAEGRPPADPETCRQGQRQFGHSWWEDAVIKRADVELALRWLKERDWRAAYVVRAYHVAGFRQRHIGGYLGVDQSTVSRFAADGLLLMVEWLNGGVRRRERTDHD